MSEVLSHPQQKTPRLLAHAIDIALTIVSIGSISTALWLYNHLPWLASTIITIIIIAFALLGQAVMFLVVYKACEVWIQWREQRELSITSFFQLIPIISKGYIRALACEIVIVFLLALFKLAPLSLFQVIAVSFTALSIVTTLLTSDYRTWNKGNDIPLVLCTGFAVQLILLLLIKLL